MIKLEKFAQNKLKLSLYTGSATYESDRDRARLIHDKTPRYKTNLQTGIDEFQFWEVPQDRLGEVLAQFHPREVICDENIRTLIEDYRLNAMPWRELDPIEGPIDFVRVPRDYQEQYIRINKRKTKLINAMLMGYGKTTSTLERAKVLQGKSSFRLLVVCPKNLRTSWKNEIKLVLGGEALVLWDKNKKKLNHLINLIPESKIVVCTYQTLKYVLEKVNELGLVYDEIVVDEAQMIGTFTAQRTKNVTDLVHKNPAAGLQLLTGTPVLHKPRHLYPLFSLVAPDQAGSRAAWFNRYEKTLRSITKVVTNPTTGAKRPVRIPIVTETQNLEELPQKLRSVMFRVRANQFTFQDTINLIEVEMEDRQRALYEQVKTQVLIELANENLEIRSQLAQMTRLLQVSEGCFNIEPTWLDSGKLNFCHDAIEQAMAEGEPLIIWSRFRKIIELLKQDYPDWFVEYHGGVNDNLKKLNVYAFQGCMNPFELDEFNQLKKLYPDYQFDPAGALILGGVMSAESGVGVNLPRCRKQISTSFSWSGSTNDQAWARIKRINQTADEVTTQIVISEDSFDNPAYQTVLSNWQKCIQIVDGVGHVTFDQTRQLIRELQRNG